MFKHVAIIASGMLFAIGLGVSGMTLPQKVIGFLDIAGDWDPSLALVMITSAGTYLIAHRYVLKLECPVFSGNFHVPSSTDIDSQLIVGAMLFGIGWGMVGLCPGPALTALVSGETQAWMFFVAMIVGIYAEGTLKVSNRILADDGATTDG